MERAAFLIEATGERIPCLLNPASLVMRRVAGVRPRFSVGGPLSGAGLPDAPLQFTGGGMTELLMDLLFDVSLVRTEPAPENVRELTEPLWRMAENQPRDGGYGRLTIVRFVWGKCWNIAGVVVAVAERLEYFTQAGTPRRSWLRLRMLRAQDETPVPTTGPETPPGPIEWPEDLDEAEVQVHDLLGDGGGETEPLYMIAQQYHGTPDTEHAIAEFNGVDDLLRLEPGLTLRIPPLPGVTE